MVGYTASAQSVSIGYTLGPMIATSLSHQDPFTHFVNAHTHTHYFSSMSIKFIFSDASLVFFWQKMGCAQ
jgi:hypothetical protein